MFQFQMTHTNGIENVELAKGKLTIIEIYVELNNCLENGINSSGSKIKSASEC